MAGFLFPTEYKHTIFSRKVQCPACGTGGNRVYWRQKDVYTGDGSQIHRKRKQKRVPQGADKGREQSMDRWEYTVPPEADGETVQQFLRRRQGLSWRMVVRLKQQPGGLTVNGVLRRTIDPLRAGEVLCLALPEDRVRIEGAELPLRVVYENRDLLVIDKPPYLAVHPSAGKPEPTLANAVVAYYEREGEPRSFRPVNRLDRNTSGLLLAAKNPHIAYALTGAVRKEYRAIVLGRLEGHGTIDRPIRVKEGCCITREVGEGGKPSVTHWETLGCDDEISYLRVVIDTGRTHQIRVHMAWLGHPLCGDTMYGEDTVYMPRHALHCGRMALTEPMTGEALSLTAPLAQDMRELLESHGIFAENTESFGKE